jgi:hypothetical protein
MTVSLAVAGAVWWLSIRPLPQPKLAIGPFPEVTDGGVRLLYPNRSAIATAFRYQDEFFAYLMSGYLRTRTDLQRLPLYLTHWRHADAPYALLVHLSDDHLVLYQELSQLAAAGLVQNYNWRLVPSWAIQDFHRQSRLFQSAYNLPTRPQMDKLPPKRLHAYLQRFIRYKSATDPRVRAGDRGPKVLSSEDAHQLAADILEVAAFFDLPLDFFLGIGAMENNYMNVRGDLQHSIWKRRPDPGDTVLERRKGRVRVLNDSAGVWQITRETLRYAHRQYRRSDRDFSQLSDHLRPPDELDIHHVQPAVLTTYAGLLLRDLLDRFDGDTTLAVGAYNGGPGNPNLRYEAGVRRVAEYARSVVEKAAALHGESAMDRSWLIAR